MLPLFNPEKSLIFSEYYGVKYVLRMHTVLSQVSLGHFFLF